jgi:hypothetical protein
MNKITSKLFFAIALALANTIFAQTKVGEIANINGSCSTVNASPELGNYYNISSISDYISCTDTTEQVIKIYSFPNLEFVKQFQIPPRGQNTAITNFSITQKWFNDDDKFEIVQYRYDTTRIDGNFITYYNTYVYNESGSVLFSLDGYLQYGVHNNTVYLYTVTTNKINNKVFVYRLRDVQTVMKQIENHFPQDVFVRLQGNELIIDAPNNMRFTLVTMDGKQVAYSKQNSQGKYIIPLNDFSGVGIVAIIDGKGKIYGKTVIAK